MGKTARSLSAKDRTALLSQIGAQVRVVLAASAKLKADAGNKKLANVYQSAMDALSGLYDRYEGSLARLEISRCPHTGEIVTLAIDNKGIDGPYWDCDRPIRPVDDFPQTVFCWTGALAQDKFSAKLPHAIMPGPSRPYVVPRFMQIPGMKAVVASFQLGRKAAYVTFYFHNDAPYDVARINVWGTQYHVAEWQAGSAYTLNLPDIAEDFDYDLRPYIEAGSLFWIKAGDKDLQLRSTAFDCPYLDLPGRDYPVYCRGGHVENTLYNPAPEVDESII